MPRGNGGIVGPVNTSFSGVWSLTEAQLRRSANTWPNFYASLLSESATGSDVFSGSGAADPYFEYTTLLLPGNGTNGAQNNTFLDGSTNNFTITRNGNTTQGTFSPFSQTGWGNYFNGSSSLTSSSLGTSIGTGDFSLEFFIYQTASAGIITPLALTMDDGNAIYLQTNSGAARFLSNSGISAISGGTVNINTWNHLLATRQGSTVRLFVNGVLVANTTSSTSFTTPTSVYIGGATTLYLGSVRVCIGSVPTSYQTSSTTNGTTIFTSPTSLLTTSSQGATAADVKLLTCQSNRFVDTSNSPKTFTISGSPTVVAFSPFNPTASWSAATNGGSGYFDGSGDYLTLPAGTAFAPGTGDFTLDGWFYASSFSGDPIIWSQTTSGSNYFMVYVSAASSTLIFIGSGISTSGAANLVLNAWNYFSVRRSSGTVTVYTNGTAGTGGSNTSDLNNTTYVPTIGRYTHAATNVFTGYIANLRFVKGTAITPSGVPTTLNTAVSGTSALLNFTNAGIYDATSKNDLETVGNAQISTAQFQFAPSSMAFDGNGDYLIMPDAQTGQFLTGDFTVEYWCRFGTQGANYASQVGTLSSASPSGTWRFGTFSNNGGVYLAYHNGSAYVDVQFGSTAYNDNTWRHFALTRSGTTVRAFVNGTQVGTNQTVSQNFNSSNKVVVGVELVNPTYFNGYIQDLRITKGYARYTANFTPPTAEFPTL